MALFKILKGQSHNLASANDSRTREGYAYFTPDDGKFYIDIKDDEAPVIGNFEGEIGEDNKPVNRICINQRIFSYNDYDILDCGTANTSDDEVTIIFDCGTSVM